MLPLPVTLGTTRNDMPKNCVSFIHFNQNDEIKFEFYLTNDMEKALKKREINQLSPFKTVNKLTINQTLGMLPFFVCVCLKY